MSRTLSAAIPTTRSGSKAKVRLPPVAGINRDCEAPVMKLALSAILVALCGGCSTARVHSGVSAIEPVPVEVISGGDDGLTQRLADAIRSEFRQSARFTLPLPAGPDALRVTIPTHVGWEKVGGSTRVTYRLRLERGGHKLAESGGFCPEENLRFCARTVVAAAERAISR
jgi:hypothetical protein